MVYCQTKYVCPRSKNAEKFVGIIRRAKTVQLKMVTLAWEYSLVREVLPEKIYCKANLRRAPKHKMMIKSISIPNLLK